MTPCNGHGICQSESCAMTLCLSTSGKTRENWWDATKCPVSYLIFAQAMRRVNATHCTAEKIAAWNARRC